LEANVNKSLCRSVFLVTSFLTIGFLCSPARLWADVTATVHGTVTDPSGNVVSGASVILRNQATGFERRVPSDTNGSFEFLAIPVGSGYEIGVTAQGFAKSVQPSITLTVNQQFRADFRLAVGAVTQQVEVSSASVQVETTSTQLGNVIMDKQLTAMPLNGRSYTDLLSLQPGVAPVTSPSGATERNPSGNLDPGILSVNGARENGNAFLVNGGEVNESRDNGTSIVPTLDAIAEFRILTNNYDAEYGKFAGGIINVVTKSGTNRLHGDLFEFLRNDALDAKNYFNPTRGSFKQNQFGATAGGRILKDRLFFFSDYQGTRQVFGVPSGNVIVPSTSERTGDFSDTGSLSLPSLTGVVQGSNASGAFAQTLSSRLNYMVSAGEPYWVPGCTSSAQAASGMCVFPNQVIPQAAWSSAAAGTLKFIPAQTGSAGLAPVWTSGSENQTLQDDKIGERIDLARTQADTLSFYYSFDNSTLNNPYAGGNVPGFPGLTPSRGQQANLRDSHIFGSSGVNTLTLNYTRYAIKTNLPSGSALGQPSAYGFESGTGGDLGIYPTAPQYAGVPAVTFTGAYSASFGVPAYINRQADDSFQISEAFSKIIGNHTFMFGGEMEYFQINTRQNILANGNFQFSGAETGNDFADFLIGAPSFYSQASLQLQNVRSKYFSLFAQDSFKVRPELTVNYGLRWDADEPYYDTRGLMMTFVPGKQSTLFPDAPTGWVFPGDPGIPTTISPTRWNNFAPRFGIAYSPSPSNGLAHRVFGGPGRTSLRAGAGIFYTGFEELIANYELGDAPFGNFWVSPTLIYFEEPFKSRVGTNDPGQRFPVPINYPGASGPPVSFAAYQPISSSQVWPTSNVLPYMEQFNLTIQRQIADAFVLTVGYVGSLGRHLIAQKDFNPGNAQTCLEIIQLYAAAGQSDPCGPNNEDQIFSVNGQTFNGIRPYSVTSGRYLSIGELDFGSDPAMGTIAVSSYHALETSLERRAGPLTFLVGYTYSKAMDDQSGFIGPFMNPYNPHASWALSAFNVTHNAVASYSYAIPFERMARGNSRVARALLGGWEISGLVRFASGQPVPMSQPVDLSLCGCPQSDVDKPNYSGTSIQFLNPRKTSNHQYFSTTPFSTETLGVPGNSRRDFFHGPGLDDWDMALHRIFPVKDTVNFEFRAEFFNVFNHAQFSATSGLITAGTLISAGNFSSAAFGDVTTARDPRIGQVALKLHF
jgi:carboxypeptidase family protein